MDGAPQAAGGLEMVGARTEAVARPMSRQVARESVKQLPCTPLVLSAPA